MCIRDRVNVISSLSIFVAIVLGFLIVYANNFIIKRRKKEIGIYLMLGMSNVKVSMILVLETILVGIISLITGILIGIGLSQLVSVFVAKLFEMCIRDSVSIEEAIQFGQSINEYKVEYRNGDDGQWKDVYKRQEYMIMENFIAK